MAEGFEKAFLDLGSFNTPPDLAAQASLAPRLTHSLILNPPFPKSWASVMAGQGLASPQGVLTSGKRSKGFLSLTLQIPQLLKD